MKRAVRRQADHRLGLVRKKKLPAIRTGKSYRIRPEDIESFERERMTIKEE